MTDQEVTTDPTDIIEDNWDKLDGMTAPDSVPLPTSVSGVVMQMQAVDSNLESLKSLQQALLLEDTELKKGDNVSAEELDVRRPASKSLLDTGFGMRNVESFHEALRDAGHEVLSHVSDDNSCPCSSSEASISVDSIRMLVKGFGLRNVDSLQRALLDDEERRKSLEEKYGKADKSEYECESLKSWPSKCSSGTSNGVGSLVSGDQKSLHRRQLEYLMGIEVIPEEFERRKASFVAMSELGEGEEESIVEDEAVSLAMRRAQRYLRTHKIFEFFQFLIAHLLSTLPENPVQFLLNLLDSCLMYRSGLGNPPLLFEMRHLVELFYLMDRMKTGFIEPEQYKTGNITYGHSPTPLKSHQPHIFQGMVTLGICSYNKNPPLSPDGMVAKETFIEEAYECLCDLLSDMIRRRGVPITPTRSTPLLTPPPSYADIAYDITHLMDG